MLKEASLQKGWVIRCILGIIRKREKKRAHFFGCVGIFVGARLKKENSQQ
jgi:hypothetical protein